MKFYKEICGEIFDISKKNGLKIADGTFDGTGCHYNDCCLFSAVKNKTSREKNTLHFSYVLF